MAISTYRSRIATAHHGFLETRAVRTERYPPSPGPRLPANARSSTVRSVKLTVKSDYAARAVLELARSFESGQARRVEDLAKAAGVSANYLVQILIELKSRGIVKSVRGKEGGYLLDREPSEVSLADVLRCVHGEVFDTPAIADRNCPDELRKAWTRLQAEATKAAEEINFQKLLEDGANKEEMYYI